MTSPFRLATVAGISLIAMQLVGCANMTMTPPAATVAHTAALRSANLAPANVGTFKIDSSKGFNDKTMSIRGNPLGAPGGSFAQYLGDTLKVELQSAGLFDAASATVITGTVTGSELDPAMSTGTGSLSARFVVTRANQVRFDRELRVEDSWESSFMGAVAIPAAAGKYEGLYRKMIDKVLVDPDFRKALAK